MEREKKSFFFSEKNKNNSIAVSNAPIVEAPLFVYKPPEVAHCGPVPPGEGELHDGGYLKHIRGATPAEGAGGYSESLACRRALQEAFDCLFI